MIKAKDTFISKDMKDEAREQSNIELKKKQFKFIGQKNSSIKRPYLLGNSDK